MIKIKTFGNRGPLSPLQRLEEEFIKLGAEIVEENPQLIFDLTGFPDDPIEYGKKYPKAIKIFNLLNADINNPNWGDGRNVNEQLLHADMVTTVSESTRKDILNRTGVDSKVIYFPIKKISRLSHLPKVASFLYVGRLFNDEKRFDLVVKTVYKMGGQNRLLVVSPEDPKLNPIVGTYFGNCNDELLNTIYNQSNILLCPCQHEGSLSMLEAVLADCIPVVSTDNEWSYEFGLQEFMANPTVDDMINKINDINQNYQEYLSKLGALKQDIRDKFEIENVAKRILNCYESIRMV